MSLIPSGFSRNASAGGAPSLYDYTIDQSLRLNGLSSGSGSYLTFTPSSSGSRTTWTFSAWAKPTVTTTAEQRVMTGSTTALRYKSNKFEFLLNNGTGWLITSAVYRDPAAWYHVIIRYDSSNATSSERMQMYVNGERITSFSTETYPPQNTNSTVNDTIEHSVGAYNLSPYAGNNGFGGYLAEVHFIDGTALDASSFGETKSGVWIPKAYTGSYGTNGFYLDFDGTYYNDKSGNGNNFTANNLAATDVVLDSPTNNFCTLNPLEDFDALMTYKEGNLEFVQASTSGQAAKMNTAGTMGVSSGKWYWESTKLSNNDVGFSVSMSSEGNHFPSIYGIYNRDGTWRVSGCTAPSNASSFSSSDIVGVAFDVDSGTCAFYKNNSLQGTITSIPTGNTYFPRTCVNSSAVSGAGAVNFGQDSSFAGNKTAQGNTDDNGYGDFYYAPPTGFLSLCSQNLSVPDAMNPALDNSPQDYFNTVLYTGDGTSSNSITGVGFQPSLVWIKPRNTVSNHAWYDAVRGVNQRLKSNSTDAESTLSGVSSFDADGFSLGSAYNETNNHVAWNWKANGSGVSNTDGSITSTVSANTDAGFSIVSYTGTGSGTPTVGHGLSSAPEIYLVKDRSATGNWVFWHTIADGSLDYMYLNSTAANANSAIPSAPTSSVVQVGGPDANDNGNNYIAYCFHSVEGFSKFGSYTGNGQSYPNTPFIYTGFRPAFVLYKRKDTATSDWWIQDSTRSPYNLIDDVIYANLSNAEDTSSAYVQIDFLSNGFKIGSNWAGNNGNGNGYIYMAFAENPFKYSTAR